MAIGLDVRAIDALPEHDDYILILHPSMSEVAGEIDAIAGLAAPLIIFHNSSFGPLTSLRKWKALAVSAVGCDPWATIELRLAGYSNPVTLEWRSSKALDSRRYSNEEDFTVIAPGDITDACPACLVIDAFAQFQEQWGGKSKLILLGRTLSARMAKSVRERIWHHNLAGKVSITGTIDQQSIDAHIEDAGVCLILEDCSSALDVLLWSIQNGVPILAKPTSVLEHVIGFCGLTGVGVLQTSPEAIAVAMVKIVNDPTYAQALAKIQHNRGLAQRAYAPEAVLMAGLGRCGLALPPEPLKTKAISTQLRFVIAGEFAPERCGPSFNQRLFDALEQRDPGSVSALFSLDHKDSNRHEAQFNLPVIQICSTEDIQASRKPYDLLVAIVSDDNWPLTPASINILNKKVAGLLVASHFQAKALVSLGLRAPVFVVGNDGRLKTDKLRAAQTMERRTQDLPEMLSADSFLFTHRCNNFISSGTDLLFKAWAQAFEASDPVRLIVCHPADQRCILWDQFNAVGSTALIELIADDASQGSAFDMVQQAHCVVLPLRDENCSDAAAQAIFSGIPFIGTRYGAHCEFVDSNAARLVEYRFVTFGEDIARLVAAEPKVDDLVASLRAAFEDHVDGGLQAQAYATAAIRVATARFNTQAWADRIVLATSQLLMERSPPLRRVAWISPWAVRCGIAEYSKALLEQLPSDQSAKSLRILLLCDKRTEAVTAILELDNIEICPSWYAGSQTIAQDVSRRLEKFDPQVLIIQHQDSLIEWDALIDLVDLGHKRQMHLIVVLHSTASIGYLNHARQASILFSLALIERVVVHSVNDLENLRAWNVIDNVMLLPHGAHPVNASSRAYSRSEEVRAGPCLGCYGFFLPNKGISLLIEAFAALREDWPDATLKLVNARYPGAESDREIQMCRALARRLMVDDAISWHLSYLDDAVSLSLLAECDLIIMPYVRSSESASGAVRLALSSGSPVAASLLPIFDDLTHAVHRVDASTPANLVDSIRPLLCDTILRRSVLDQASGWLKARNWQIISQQLFGMAHGLFQQPRVAEQNLNVRYPADCPLLFTQVGERHPTCIVFSGKPGFGLFGPYVRLPSGQYIIKYDFDRRARLSGTVHLKVYAARGTLQLAMIDIDFDDGAMREEPIELSFRLLEPLADVEVVVVCTDSFHARLKAISIQKTPTVKTRGIPTPIEA